PGTPKTPGGRPVYVRTPGGTKLERFKDHGVILLFSNYAEPMPPLDLEEAGQVGTEKIQTLHVTESFLEDVARERAQLGNRRNQVSIMGGSANEEAQAIGSFQEGDRWEWLHLIAWRILGPD